MLIYVILSLMHTNFILVVLLRTSVIKCAGSFQSFSLSLLSGYSADSSVMHSADIVFNEIMVEETKNDLQNDLKKELYHRLQVELGTIEEASSFEVKETKNDLKNDLKKELSYRLQVALGTIEEEDDVETTPYLPSNSKCQNTFTPIKRKSDEMDLVTPIKQSILNKLFKRLVNK